MGAVLGILGVQIGPLDGCGQILSTEPLRTSFRDEMWIILGPILGSDFTKCYIRRESFLLSSVVPLWTPKLKRFCVFCYPCGVDFESRFDHEDVFAAREAISNMIR